VPILTGYEFGSQPGIARGVARVGRGTLYLLNQFDASSPLHLDVREMLQQQLGDRLLPFVLRRSSAVSEALAEGMTVIDYAPDSPVAKTIGFWPVGCAALLRRLRWVRWECVGASDEPVRLKRMRATPGWIAAVLLLTFVPAGHGGRLGSDGN
jgi:hypothetical protein